MGVWRAPYLPPTPPRQQAHLPPVRMRSCLSIQIRWDPLSQLTKNQPTSPSSLEPLLGPAFIIAHLDPCGRSGAFPDSRPYIHLCFLRQPREGTCEHYSQVPSLHCSQPSRAPTSLWVKAYPRLCFQPAVNQGKQSIRECAESNLLAAEFTEV